MSKIIDLFEEHKYAVTLSHADGDDLGSGTLTFGADKWAHVSLRDSTKTRELVEGTKWPIIKAKTEDGRSFTLFDCAIKGRSFYADYVVLGDVVPGDLQQISIRYTDISEWFANWQRLEGELGDKLTWINRPKPLSVTVPSEQLTISTEYVGSLERSGEDHILHEHIEVVVGRSSGEFTLVDIQKTTLEISCLFSILLAHPVSLVNVTVAAKGAPPHQVYFPGFKRVDKKLSDDGYMTRCFIQARDIEDRWQTIFERYYKSTFRKVIWVRLSGMQRYDSFWEYKALGYVSLLDQYVTQATQGKTKPTTLSAKKISKLEGAIGKVSPPMSATQRDTLMGLICSALQDERELNFAEQLEEAFKNGDADIAKIIDLSPEAFTYIKKVRDAVAHGGDPKIPGRDFTQVSILITKIELLLTYWAFMDFGLTKDDFLRCLARSHSRLRFTAQVNDAHLDRVTKNAEFFSVPETQFHELAKIKNIQFDACFILTENGGIQYSERYSKMHWDWLRDRSRKGGSYSHAEIFGVTEDAVRYVSKAYIESGANQLRLSPIYLFDVTKLPSA